MKTLNLLYDILVFLTNHYSEMPTEFTSRFSETECNKVRQKVFNFLFID